jgi:putative phosphoesterase
MKIGLISDIHGNLNHLHKALLLFQDLAIKTILCAGDLVDGQQYGDSVVTLLRYLAIPSVQGNHDYDAVVTQAALKIAIRDSLVTTRPVEKFLNARTIAFLEALPLTRTFIYGAVHLLVAHGTPWNNTTYVFPDSSPDLFEQIVLKSNAEIIVLGHTHVPMSQQVNQCWIVNPGSVDQNRNSTIASCAVIETQPFGAQIFDLNARRIIRTCGSMCNA